MKKYRLSDGRVFDQIRLLIWPFLLSGFFAIATLPFATATTINPRLNLSPKAVTAIGLLREMQHVPSNLTPNQAYAWAARQVLIRRVELAPQKRKPMIKNVCLIG